MKEPKLWMPCPWLSQAVLAGRINSIPNLKMKKTTERAPQGPGLDFASLEFGIYGSKRRYGVVSHVSMWIIQRYGAQYFHAIIRKGMPVVCTGELRTWKDKDGRYNHELYCDKPLVIIDDRAHWKTTKEFDSAESAQAELESEESAQYGEPYSSPQSTNNLDYDPEDETS